MKGFHSFLFYIYKLHLFQGKGDVSTYWLLSSDEPIRIERLQNNVLSSLYPDFLRNSPQARRKYLNQTTPRGSIKGSPAVLPSRFDRSVRSSNLSLSHRAEKGRLPSRAELEPLVDSVIH